MKYLIAFLFLFGSIQASAQQYILLDKTMSQRAFYSNKVSLSEEDKGFFPVEKKDIEKFISALQEIAKRLSSTKVSGPARQYRIGCIEFNGEEFPLARTERLDYTIHFNCDGVKTSMHLVDARLDNAANAYFVKTWIKYIQNNVSRLNKTAKK